MLKKCNVCGREFEANTRQIYCSDNCRKIGNQIIAKKYQAKIQQQKTVEVVEETPKAKRIVFGNGIVTYNQEYATQVTQREVNHADYLTRCINALRQLDNAHKEVQSIIDVLKIEQSRYYKEDNDFTHLVEGSGALSDTEKLKIFNEYRDTRSKRRNVKDVLKTLICCIKYLPNDTEQILKDAIANKIKTDEFFKEFYKSQRE